MPAVARADIEALLRAKKLDNTLTSAHFQPGDASVGRGSLASQSQDYVVATGIDVLDSQLGGGLARGQMSEIVGSRSSGRTSLLMCALATAASQGELVALVDTFDVFDPQAARGAGLDLGRLLWVRGSSRGVHDFGQGANEIPAAIDRALKAFNLILQAGGFGLVALDLADAPRSAIKRLPFTTWLRLQRPIEGSSTACLLVGSAATARSAGGVTIALQRVSERCKWGRLFPGINIEARVARSRGVAQTCEFHLDGKSPYDRQG